MKINDFWQRVRSLSREKRITQVELARASGVAYSTFRKWITKNVIPPLDVASAISIHFGISLDYLAFGKEYDATEKIREILKSLAPSKKSGYKSIPRAMQ